MIIQVEIPLLAFSNTPILQHSDTPRLQDRAFPGSFFELRLPLVTSAALLLSEQSRIIDGSHVRSPA